VARREGWSAFDRRASQAGLPRKNEPRRESTDTQAEQSLAAQAWWVLHGWTGFPGREDDGSLTATTMTAWVRAARLELSDANRADIGDEMIGQTFAHSPWTAAPTASCPTGGAACRQPARVTRETPA
jgi:hypothetical protein